MRKTMFSLSLPLLAMAVFLLAQAVPAECLTAEGVQSYVDEAKALDLSEGNLKLTAESSEEILKDDHFMALLRGRLRIARLLKAATRAEGEGAYALRVEAGPVVAFLCQGGVPTLDRLVQGAVDQVVKPLQLEAILKELPRYYEAVVGTADWQKKFDKIMGDGEYPSIQRGKIFHIAGFPEIGDKPYYTAAMDIDLKDGTMYLSEWDASAEGWLYSFWMRRWREGTMETAKIAVDLLNKALGQ